jgi:hypothetical protein
MRQEIVNCKYRYQALNKCPWACRIARAYCAEERNEDGDVIAPAGIGFICFESDDDYRQWRGWPPAK